MPMLGDILASARRDAPAFESWLHGNDRALAAALTQAASEQGMSASDYARMAIADFCRLADEEDWATLMSGIREAGDPGMICLTAMANWRIAARACAHHQSSVAEGI